MNSLRKKERDKGSQHSQHPSSMSSSGDKNLYSSMKAQKVSKNGEKRKKENARMCSKVLKTCEGKDVNTAQKKCSSASSDSSVLAKVKTKKSSSALLTSSLPQKKDSATLLTSKSSKQLITNKCGDAQGLKKHQGSFSSPHVEILQNSVGSIRCNFDLHNSLNDKSSETPLTCTTNSLIAEQEELDYEFIDDQSVVTSTSVIKFHRNYEDGLSVPFVPPSTGQGLGRNLGKEIVLTAFEQKILLLQLLRVKRNSAPLSVAKLCSNVTVTSGSADVTKFLESKKDMVQNTLDGSVDFCETPSEFEECSGVSKTPFCEDSEKSDFDCDSLNSLTFSNGDELVDTPPKVCGKANSKADIDDKLCPESPPTAISKSLDWDVSLQVSKKDEPTSPLFAGNSDRKSVRGWNFKRVHNASDDDSESSDELDIRHPQPLASYKTHPTEYLEDNTCSSNSVIRTHVASPARSPVRANILMETDAGPVTPVASPALIAIPVSSPSSPASRGNTSSSQANDVNSSSHASGPIGESPESPNTTDSSQERRLVNGTYRESDSSSEEDSVEPSTLFARPFPVGNFVSDELSELKEKDDDALSIMATEDAFSVFNFPRAASSHRRLTPWSLCAVTSSEVGKPTRSENNPFALPSVPPAREIRQNSLLFNEAHSNSDSSSLNQPIFQTPYSVAPTSNKISVSHLQSIAEPVCQTTEFPVNHSRVPVEENQITSVLPAGLSPVTDTEDFDSVVDTSFPTEVFVPALKQPFVQHQCKESSALVSAEFYSSVVYGVASFNTNEKALDSIPMTVSSDEVNPYNQKECRKDAPTTGLAPISAAVWGPDKQKSNKRKSNSSQSNSAYRSTSNEARTFCERQLLNGDCTLQNCYAIHVPGPQVSKYVPISSRQRLTELKKVIDEYPSPARHPRVSLAHFLIEVQSHKDDEGIEEEMVAYLLRYYLVKKGTVAEARSMIPDILRLSIVDPILLSELKPLFHPPKFDQLYLDLCRHVKDQEVAVSFEMLNYMLKWLEKFNYWPLFWHYVKMAYDRQGLWQPLGNLNVNQALESLSDFRNYFEHAVCLLERLPILKWSKVEPRLYISVEEGLEGLGRNELVDKLRSVLDSHISADPKAFQPFRNIVRSRNTNTGQPTVWDTDNRHIIPNDLSSHVASCDPLSLNSYAPPDFVSHANENVMYTSETNRTGFMDMSERSANDAMKSQNTVQGVMSAKMDDTQHIWVNEQDQQKPYNKTLHQASTGGYSDDLPYTDPADDRFQQPSADVQLEFANLKIIHNKMQDPSCLKKIHPTTPPEILLTNYRTDSLLLQPRTNEQPEFASSQLQQNSTPGLQSRRLPLTPNEMSSWSSAHESTYSIQLNAGCQEPLTGLHQETAVRSSKSSDRVVTVKTSQNRFLKKGNDSAGYTCRVKTENWDGAVRQFLDNVSAQKMDFEVLQKFILEDLKNTAARFQKFITELRGKIPTHLHNRVRRHLGQLGIVIFKQCHRCGQFAVAFNVLMTLHKEHINYFELQETSSHGRVVTMSKLALSIVEVCLHFKKYKSAIIALRHADWAVPCCTSLNHHNERQLRLKLFKRLVLQLLEYKCYDEATLTTDKLIESYDDDMKILQKDYLDVMDLSDLCNTVIVALVKNNVLNLACLLYEKSSVVKLTLEPPTLRALIKMLKIEGQYINAQEVFLRAYKSGIYPFQNYSRPWCICIRSYFTKEEIGFILKYFLVCLADVMRQPNQTWGPASKQVLRINIEEMVPKDCGDLEILNEPSSLQDVIDRVRCVAAQMQPPLNLVMRGGHRMLEVTADALRGYLKSLGCEPSSGEIESQSTRTVAWTAFRMKPSTLGALSTMNQFQ